MFASFVFVLCYRLSQYSSFSMTNKLYTMLGSMEDKVRQAKSQGSTHRVDNSLLSLSQKYTPNSELSLFIIKQ